MATTAYAKTERSSASVEYAYSSMYVPAGVNFVLPMPNGIVSNETLVPGDIVRLIDRDLCTGKYVAPTHQTVTCLLCCENQCMTPIYDEAELIYLGYDPDEDSLVVKSFASSDTYLISCEKLRKKVDNACINPPGTITAGLEKLNKRHSNWRSSQVVVESCKDDDVEALRASYHKVLADAHFEHMIDVALKQYAALGEDPPEEYVDSIIEFYASKRKEDAHNYSVNFLAQKIERLLGTEYAVKKFGGSVSAMYRWNDCSADDPHFGKRTKV